MEETATRVHKAINRDVEPEAPFRTMQQDVSAALAGGRPKAIAVQPAVSPPSPHAATVSPAVPRTATLAVVALGLVGIAVAGVAILSWSSRRRSPPPPPGPPAPFIFFEETREITIAPTAGALRRAFEDPTAADRADGSLERIAIRSRNEAGLPTVIEAKALFGILGIAAGDEFFAPLKNPPQFFTYAQAGALRAGIMIPSDDPLTTFRDLTALEPVLGEHLDAIGIDELPPPAYQASSYRNIDYRYLAIDPEFDFGFGYLAFPARHAIVMATSEEAIRVIITRLFESR